LAVGSLSFYLGGVFNSLISFLSISNGWYYKLRMIMRLKEVELARDGILAITSTIARRKRDKISL